MSKKPKRQVVRQGDFRVVARGIHRVKPDYSRLIQATTEHYTSTLNQDPATTQPRPSSTEDQEGDHDQG